MSRRACACLVLLAVAGCAREAPPPGDRAPREALAVEHVTVVDVAAGRLLPDRTVLIEAGRITRMRESERVLLPPGARRLDGRGRYLIPGLWDLHVHSLFDLAVAREFLPRFLEHGVTGVRDMGGSLAVLRTVREEIAAGRLSAPRLLAAGAVLDGPEPVVSSVSVAVASAEDVPGAVDSLVRAGADFLKVYTLLPRDAYFATLREARTRGLVVAGHVPLAVRPREASDSGQRSIEHLRDELDLVCRVPEDPECGALLEAFRRNRTAQVPTLAVLRAKSLLGDSTLLADPRLERVPALLREGWERAREALRDRPPVYFEAKRARFGNALALTLALHEAGVPVLAGTDAGALYTYPGSSLHDELVLLVEAGLTPLEALRSATSAAAEFLGTADSLGAVEEGRLADLVLLEADPLAEIGAVRRVVTVIVGGRVHAPSAPGSGPAR